MKSTLQTAVQQLARHKTSGLRNTGENPKIKKNHTQGLASVPKKSNLTCAWASNQRKLSTLSTEKSMLEEYPVSNMKDKGVKTDVS